MSAVGVDVDFNLWSGNYLVLITGFDAFVMYS